MVDSILMSTEDGEGPSDRRRPRGPESATMQVSADEARADELRMVINYLYAQGARALALEITDLRHRQDIDPS